MLKKKNQQILLKKINKNNEENIICIRSIWTYNGGL